MSRRTPATRGQIDYLARLARLPERHVQILNINRRMMERIIPVFADLKKNAESIREELEKMRVDHGIIGKLLKNFQENSRKIPRRNPRASIPRIIPREPPVRESKELPLKESKEPSAKSPCLEERDGPNHQGVTSLCDGDIAIIGESDQQLAPGDSGSKCDCATHGDGQSDCEINIKDITKSHDRRIESSRR